MPRKQTPQTPRDRVRAPDMSNVRAHKAADKAAADGEQPGTLKHTHAHRCTHDASTRQHTPAHTSTRQHTPVHTSTRQYTPVHQYTPAHASTRQYTPVHASTRQNTPEHSVKTHVDQLEVQGEACVGLGVRAEAGGWERAQAWVAPRVERRDVRAGTTLLVERHRGHAQPHEPREQ